MHARSFALLPVLSLACAGDVALETGGWGIGDVVDCDPSGERCWPEADRASLTSAVRDLGGVMAIAPEGRRDVLRGVLEGLRRVEHKMTADEIDALGEIEAALAEATGTLSDEATAATAAEIRRRVLHRLENAMIAAHMVPVERDIDALVESGVCDGSAVACLAGDSGLPIAIPSRYAPGTREALEQIASAGILGKTVATMLIVDGVLEPDYHVENARLFGELDERTGLMTPNGLSVTARVERIIDRAQRLAAWAGAISGAEALIPIAGIALSIAHEEWMLLEIHVEMMLRIAEVYGWDLAEAPTLILALAVVMQDGTLPDGTDIFVESVSVATLVREARMRFGLWTAGRITSFLAQKAGRWLWGILTAKARERLTGEVIRGGARAVASEIFGWLTMGATVAVSAAWDGVHTGVIGHRSASTAKRWLGDLPREGSTVLATAAARDCAFTLWGRMALEDGRLDDLELRLYQALMANGFWTSDREKLAAPFAEQVSRGARLRQLLALRTDPALLDGATSCAGDVLAELDSRQRTTLLSYLSAMMQIDRDEDRAERLLHDGLRDRLTGPLWDRVGEVEMDQIERSIRSEARLPDSELALQNGLTILDFVPALAAPEATRRAFEQGFGRP